MHIPAHKQTDPDKIPGQIVNTEKTLSDYIRRKTRHDAFNQVNAEKKLTFDEWIKDNLTASAEAIWKAAQENK